MRFLGVGETCDLGALYLSLAAEGHDVRVAVSHPLAQGTMRGLVEIVSDWRAELDWVRAAWDDGIILFESVTDDFGATQDSLRRKGYNVIGGSAYGDRLENDRAYAQSVFDELGLATASTWTFAHPASAADFILRRPARYVLKRSGAGHDAGDTYVGMLADGRDVVALLRSASPGDRPMSDWLLMEHIDGIEMGVGAYFDGERFLTPACLDWEHKRFFAGDLGELTGEMGTVATFDRSDHFFALTLAKLEPRLREHGYVGYINLNTIVNDRGIWPLELTCRFGYPGFAVLAPLQATPWGALFASLVQRRTAFEARPGFTAGVVVTTPPFPYSREDIAEAVGLPVLIDAAADRESFHLGEVGLDASGQLVTTGLYGWTMVVTGTGPSVADAKAAAYRQLGHVSVARMRWRLDIGDTLIDGNLQRLEQLGMFGGPTAGCP